MFHVPSLEMVASSPQARSLARASCAEPARTFLKETSIADSPSKVTPPPPAEHTVVQGVGSALRSDR